MNRIDLEERYIAATLTPSIGGATLRALMRRHLTIEGIWDAMGVDDAAPLRKIQTFWETEGRARAKQVREATLKVPGGRVYCWEDEDYPIALRDVSNPPGVLYVRGDLARLTRRALALVGTTDPTAPFARVATSLARTCAVLGIHVVSGLAKGIDAASLRAAAEMEVPAFGVIGHGIDFEYPASSRSLYTALAQRGAVISQFPTGTQAQRWTFPMRNELMCTLAYGTVIVQANSRDGSLIQADFSFKHGRDVIVHSANADEPDHEWFIRLRERGAHTFTTFDEVLEIVRRRHSQFDGGAPVAAVPGAAPQQLLFASDGPTLDGGSPVLLLDIDGVVADTQPYEERALAAALETFGVRLSPEQQSELSAKSPAGVAREHGLDWTRFRNEHAKHLEAALSASDIVIPEMRALLHELRERGWRLGAVTSQPKRRALLTLKRDVAFFDVLITYNDTPRRTKPEPDPLLLAATRLGIDPVGVRYVGDTRKDLLAARAARMSSIAVLWGYDSEEQLRRYSPDHLVATVAELAVLLEDVTVGTPA